jgi:hypothetical protein
LIQPARKNVIIAPYNLLGSPDGGNMPRKHQAAKKDVPPGKQIFRCWVELLDLKTGVKRELPLTGIQKIHIPRKKNDPRLPDEHVLQLRDGETVTELKDLDELVAQLRARYPDEAYERRLFHVRDLEAEKRRADALNGLVEIIAQAAVEKLPS